MVRYHLTKDGALTGTSVATLEQAIDLIRTYQEKETHYMLRSEYGYIKGEDVIVPYK